MTVEQYWLTMDGKTQSITQWADELSIKRTTLCQRINHYKWPIAKALTTGVHNGKR